MAVLYHLVDGEGRLLVVLADAVQQLVAGGDPGRAREGGEPGAVGAEDLRVGLRQFGERREQLAVDFVELVDHRRRGPCLWRAAAYRSVRSTECGHWSMRRGAYSGNLEGGGAGRQGRRQPAVRAQCTEPRGFETAAVERAGAGDEAVLVALGGVLAGEGLEEGHAAAEFGQPRQAAVDFARLQVVQH